MNELFIPYEQALALKELGFDEPCFVTYNIDKKISRNPSHNMEDLPIEGQPYYWNNSKININCITTPLYQQAFRWFREKYKIIGKVNDNSILENTYSISISKIFDSHILYANGRNHNLKDKQGFTTYEEAELECLKKLIEIVKNK